MYIVFLLRILMRLFKLRIRENDRESERERESGKKITNPLPETVLRYT